MTLWELENNGKCGRSNIAPVSAEVPRSSPCSGVKGVIPANRLLSKTMSITLIFKVDLGQNLWTLYPEEPTCPPARPCHGPRPLATGVPNSGTIDHCWRNNGKCLWLFPSFQPFPKQCSHFFSCVSSWLLAGYVAVLPPSLMIFFGKKGK